MMMTMMHYQFLLPFVVFFSICPQFSCDHQQHQQVAPSFFSTTTTSILTNTNWICVYVFQVYRYIPFLQVSPRVIDKEIQKNQNHCHHPHKKNKRSQIKVQRNLVDCRSKKSYITKKRQMWSVSSGQNAKLCAYVLSTIKTIQGVKRFKTI